jgi:CRISPR/Cas system CMR subunit Cmr6 (Cas7 group RAMP superfamily)
MSAEDTNIGLYFYRGYYEGYFGKDGYLLSKLSKEKQLDVADKKNAKFKEYSNITLNKCFKIKDCSPIELKTIYPGLYTGSGYTFGAGLNGEFQTGFLFDHTTGLPYLPGSSVKGAIRNAFPDNQKSHKSERIDIIWDYLETFAQDHFTEQFSKETGRKDQIVTEIELEIFEGRNIGKEKKKPSNGILTLSLGHPNSI